MKYALEGLNDIQFGYWSAGCLAVTMALALALALADRRLLYFNLPILFKSLIKFRNVKVCFCYLFNEET